MQAIGEVVRLPYVIEGGERCDKLVASSSKYPENSRVSKLTSPLEIKVWWLYNEWHPKCDFSRFVQKDFPTRGVLCPLKPTAEMSKIEETFYFVRGQYTLWGERCEKGKWRKIVIEKLALSWIRDNVEFLYPHDTVFEVTELNGIVLWKDPITKKYQLLEGNHRISAWLKAKEPEFLPAILYLGKTAKQFYASTNNGDD